MIRLTPQERKIILLSGRGLTEIETAHILQISPNTARVHVENAKRKLGALNKAHAIVLALVTAQIDLAELA